MKRKLEAAVAGLIGVAGGLGSYLLDCIAHYATTVDFDVYLVWVRTSLSNWQIHVIVGLLFANVYLLSRLPGDN